MVVYADSDCRASAMTLLDAAKSLRGSNSHWTFPRYYPPLTRIGLHRYQSHFACQLLDKVAIELSLHDLAPLTRPALGP